MHGQQDMKFASDFSRNGNANLSSTNNFKISDTMEKSSTLESLWTDPALQPDNMLAVHRCCKQNDS